MYRKNTRNFYSKTSLKSDSRTGFSAAKIGNQISVFLTGIKIKNDICLMAEERQRLLDRAKVISIVLAMELSRLP